MFIRLALIVLVALSPIEAVAQTEATSGPWSGEAQPRGDLLLKATMLATHASVRQPYESPNLTWSDDLAADALAYARTLATTRVFAHDPQTGNPRREGENLSMGTRGAYSYAELAGFWTDERTDYHPGVFPEISRSGNWHKVGHYTQMVWPSTREIGCAIASNDSDDYLVCRYLPAGNVVGVAMR